jgi:hypothetical protein
MVLRLGNEMTSGLGARIGSVATLVVVGIVAVIILGGSLGTIRTGNVGVRTTLGIMSPKEITPGVYMKWPLISRVDEFSAKEIAIDLTDLTPKAKDNLSLRDMDISVYYRAEAQAVAELGAKYAGQSVESDEGFYMPAYNLIFRIARNTAYEEVAKVDSLVMHTRRDARQYAKGAGRQRSRRLQDHAHRGSRGGDRSLDRGIDQKRSRQSKEARSHGGADTDCAEGSRNQSDRGAGHRRGQPNHRGQSDPRVPATRSESGLIEIR